MVHRYDKTSITSDFSLWGMATRIAITIGERPKMVPRSSSVRGSRPKPPLVVVEMTIAITMRQGRRGIRKPNKEEVK